MADRNDRGGILFVFTLEGGGFCNIYSGYVVVRFERWFYTDIFICLHTISHMAASMKPGHPFWSYPPSRFFFLLFGFLFFNGSFSSNSTYRVYIFSLSCKHGHKCFVCLPLSNAIFFLFFTLRSIYDTPSFFLGHFAICLTSPGASLKRTNPEPYILGEFDLLLNMPPVWQQPLAIWQPRSLGFHGNAARPWPLACACATRL